MDELVADFVPQPPRRRRAARLAIAAVYGVGAAVRR